jgi:hypothetical protein
MSFVPAIVALWLLSSLGPSVANSEAAVTTVRWLFVLVAVVIRLGFMATTIAFFQAELAHAGYTARPVPTWPDSPAVEAIAAIARPSRQGLDPRTSDGRPDRPLPL